MVINMQSDVDSNLTSQTPLWLQRFIDVYQTLSTKNLGLLDTIYHKEVTFIDPIHKIEGLENLHHYFHHLYENLSSCDFVIEQVIAQEKQAAIYWQMSYQHPKLNKGKLVVVKGNSHVKAQENKIIYHRDYLDLGAMLYEQLPVFGQLTKWIKTKASS